MRTGPETSENTFRCSMQNAMVSKYYSPTRRVTSYTAPARTGNRFPFTSNRALHEIRNHIDCLLKRLPACIICYRRSPSGQSADVMTLSVNKIESARRTNTTRTRSISQWTVYRLCSPLERSGTTELTCRRGPLAGAASQNSTVWRIEATLAMDGFPSTV